MESFENYFPFTRKINAVSSVWVYTGKNAAQILFLS